LKKKREFLIYESAFSDILGIMIFFYLISSVGKGSTGEVVLHISLSLGLTIILSVIIGYLMVILLEKLRSQVKLFLLISVILITSAIIAVSLMIKGEDREFADKLVFNDWDELDQEIESLSKKS